MVMTALRPGGWCAAPGCHPHDLPKTSHLGAVKMPINEPVGQRVGRWSGETTGIAGGAVVGALLAGPAGAAGGAIVGEALKTVLGEMADRVLSRGEVRRTNTLAWFAEREIRAALDRGRPLRTDGFFDADTSDRSAADEVFEGVFLAAQREPEERKLALLGKMMARLAFSPTIDRSECNLLIRLAQQLSYRQFCLLSLFNLANRDTYHLRSDIANNPWDLHDNDPRVGVLQEVLDLHRHTLVQQKSLAHIGHDIMVNIFLIAPGQTHVVAGLGGLLTQLMGLATSISFTDRDAVAALLG